MVENMIVIGILAVIVGLSVWYLYRAKKRGNTCVGCPYSKQCNGGCAHSRATEKSESR